MGQSLMPPHSGRCFYHRSGEIYITSECAETSGVKGSTPESPMEDIFSGALNIRMKAVRLFGSLKLCQCRSQGKISWLTSYNKNYGDKKNASGRAKSTNSSSELSNKRSPLICIKDQTMPISIFQQAGESSPKSYSSCQLHLDLYQIDIGLGLVRRKISWLTF